MTAEHLYPQETPARRPVPAAP
uniref:Uncharacterized protein n=1 Tax=Arundo donax TaxID=35708 RepID=A0A0A9I0Q6_ARUDO